MLGSPTIALTKRELLSALRSGRLFLFLAGMVAITCLLLLAVLFLLSAGRIFRLKRFGRNTS